MLSAIIILRRDAGCYYAERRYAECRYAECRYAECRDAINFEVINLFFSYTGSYRKTFYGRNLIRIVVS